MLNIFILSLISLYFTVTTSYVTTSYVNSISLLYQHKPQLLTLKTSKKLNKLCELNKLNKFNKLTNMRMSEEYLNIQQYVNDNNSNFSQSIKETKKYLIDSRINIKLLDMPSTDEQINISSIYLNLEKAKGVYFSKDVKNVIFTFPNDLSDLYYYDVNNNDTQGVLYRVSNNTRINMKNLKKFVFQTFNNNIDGILF
jgi:hypothetical protein